MYIHLSHEDWPILSHAYNRIDIEQHPARHYSMFLAPFNAIKKEWAIRTCPHASKFSIEDRFGNYTDERVWLAWPYMDRHYPFLLHEWQQNRLNNVLDIIDTIHLSFHKYQSWEIIVTDKTTNHEACVSCVNSP